MKTVGRWKRLLIAAVLIGLVALLLGSRSNDTYRPSGPTTRMVFLDSSPSQYDPNEPRRWDDWLYSIPYAGRLSAALSAPRDALRVYRFDQVPTLIRFEIPSDEAVFVAGLQHEFNALRDGRKKKGDTTDRITRPALMFEAAMHDLQLVSKDRDVEIYIMWDGSNDDKSLGMNKIYKDAAAGICADPRVKRLVIWGVRGGMGEIQTYFGSLGDRLHIYGVREELHS